MLAKEEGKRIALFWLNNTIRNTPRQGLSIKEELNIAVSQLGIYK